MRTVRASLGVLAVGVIAFLIATVLIGTRATPAPSDGLASRAAPTLPTSEPAASEDTEASDPDAVDGDDAEAEAAEQGEGVQRRREAFEAADAVGAAGQAGTRSYVEAAAGTTGWVGEIPISATADDWEPAIATDSASRVFLLTTRYGAKPCSGNCPSPYIALTISQNGGVSWGAPKPLCACKGSGQFDPIIEVVPSTGAVYAAYLNGFNVMFTKSTDHGVTWSAPVKTYGNVSWTDKPALAMSDDGRNVYVSFNGPTGGDPYVARSTDFGATWSQVKVINSNRYYFAFDADVASDGTVYFAESGILYGGGGNKGTVPTGTIDEHVFVSRDAGATWQDHIVAQVQPGLACVAAGCTPDFYLGHVALSADGNGALVYLYDGATTAGGKQTISAKTSTDHGTTWSAATVVSTVGEEATMPMVESRGSGDVRMAWMETSGGGNVDAWNAWYRSSTNGGATWSVPVRISDATSGAAYKTAAGFAEVYGDYGEIAITSAGKTIATWGEGTSYDGPGGVWVNRQP